MSAGGIRPAEISVKFLHSNSTSHVTAFSAIAELIDNAYDPDVQATKMYIDKRVVQGQVCLTFLDDGKGMNPEELYRMLGFGFSDKEAVGEHKPIGRYGNGFKSGSMRLGNDAIVFTKQKNTMSVGLLSRTYLKEIEATNVLVPIVSWQRQNCLFERIDSATRDLEDICKYSLFKSEDDLLKEFEEMKEFKTGTQIIIYNLKRCTPEMLELDFESDPRDIRNPKTTTLDDTPETRKRNVSKEMSKSEDSLYDFCRILFDVHRMDTFIRGRKVRPMHFRRNLLDVDKEVYKPKYSKEQISVTIGFARSNKKQPPPEYGLIMYYNNRRIEAYKKIGIQKQQDGHGYGVILLADASCLTPTHNKQSFDDDQKYRNFIAKMEAILKDYWNKKRGDGSKSVDEGTIPNEGLWVQCDECKKYRRLPVGIEDDDLQDKWKCYMNQDSNYNRCEIREEDEFEGEYEVDKTSKKINKKTPNKTENLEKLKKSEAILKKKIEKAQTEKLQADVILGTQLEVINNITNSPDFVNHIEATVTPNPINPAKSNLKRKDKICETLVRSAEPLCTTAENSDPMTSIVPQQYEQDIDQNLTECTESAPSPSLNKSSKRRQSDACKDSGKKMSAASNPKKAKVQQEPDDENKPDINKLNIQLYKKRLDKFVKKGQDLLKRIDMEKDWAMPENVREAIYSLANTLTTEQNGDEMTTDR